MNHAGLHGGQNGCLKTPYSLRRTNHIPYAQAVEGTAYNKRCIYMKLVFLFLLHYMHQVFLNVLPDSSYDGRTLALASVRVLVVPHQLGKVDIENPANVE